MNMKWNKLNKKQPKIGQKIIWKNNNNTGSYPIYYGIYLGTEYLSNKILCAFRLWFNGNISVYGNISNIIWIPYPVGED